VVVFEDEWASVSPAREGFRKAWWLCSEASVPRCPPRARRLRGDCGRHREGMRTASVSPAREGFRKAWWLCSEASVPRCPPRARGLRGDCGRHREGMRTASAFPACARRFRQSRGCRGVSPRFSHRRVRRLLRRTAGEQASTVKNAANARRAGESHARGPSPRPHRRRRRAVRPNLWRPRSAPATGSGSGGSPSAVPLQ
jgi:hypothetical protein